jgi:hypothetical protein
LKAQAPSPQRPTPREPSSIGGERAWGLIVHV